MSEIFFEPREAPEEGILTVIQRRGIYRIPVAAIRYLQKERRRIWVIWGGGPVAHYGKLEEMEGLLPDTFFRCHNSITVNFRYVDRLEEGTLHLTTGETLAVSQRKRAPLRRAYRRFLDRLHRV